MKTFWAVSLAVVGKAALCLELVSVQRKKNIYHIVPFWTKRPISCMVFYWYKQMFYKQGSGNLDLYRKAGFSESPRVLANNDQSNTSTHHSKWDISPPSVPTALSLMHLSLPTRPQPTGNQVNPCKLTLTFTEQMSPSTQLIYFVMSRSCH